MKNSNTIDDPLFGSSEMIWDAFAYRQAQQISLSDRDILDKGDVGMTRSNRQQDIIDAADKLIRHYGHIKTSMEDIAKAIGTSRANIYRFFPTKEALDERVFARQASRMLERARLAAERQSSAGRQLLVAINSLVDETVSMIDVDPNMHRLFATAFTEDWDSAHVYVGAFMALIQEIITKGISTRAFEASSPEEAARFVVTSILVFIHPTLMMDGALKYPGVISDPATHVRHILAYLGSSD